MTILTQEDINMANSKVLNALLDMKNKIETKSDGYFFAVGLCGNLEEYLTLEEIEQIDLENIYHKWPEFSGNFVFPVPHPSVSPRVAYLRHKQDMYENEYGASRIRLLDFLISQLS